MRAALLFLVLNTVLLSQDDQLPTLESILSASEKQQFDRAANFQEVLKVLRRVLDRFAETARRQLDSQDLDPMKESVQAIRRLARDKKGCSGRGIKPAAGALTAMIRPTASPHRHS